jgi:hypothetical protein
VMKTVVVNQRAQEIDVAIRSDKDQGS